MTGSALQPDHCGEIDHIVARIKADIARLEKLRDGMGPDHEADRVFIHDVIRRRQEMIEKLTTPW